MNELAKIKPVHLRRAACIYLRQSSQAQVEFNRESTARQYALVDRAADLGWPREQIAVIDEDLGVSGAGFVARGGFARLTAEVALGHVGIVLGLEVSRLARNNADWYRLLDLCGLADTLIGDADGIYHPGLFNDRLLLGLKGTMSEAELHVLRARLDGGIRNKAARGELRRGLPVGFVWGETDGEIRFHPDAAVIAAIRAVFDRFAELGSARRVWLWLRTEGLAFPLQFHAKAEIRWVAPSYTAIHGVLTNPVYGGAYAYGKSRSERFVDENGRLKQRMRRLPRAEWSVLIPDHHPGFIDWQTYEANQARLAANTRPLAHRAGGAVREGSALLQGLASCGHCGRRLRTHYRGRRASPGYHCAGKEVVNGRGVYCLNVGGVQIDQAVAQAFLTVLQPAAIDAALAAAERLAADREAALAQWRMALERAEYEAARAERRYRAVDPDNRLVARGLEAEWERCLRECDQSKAELARRQQQRPQAFDAAARHAMLRLGCDIERIWSASTTAPRDRKELLRTLLEDVTIAVHRDAYRAHLTLRWRGGALTELDVDLPRSRPATVRTDEATLALVRRLAAHYPDDVIAGILNRQDRITARGLRFTVNHVGNLRRHWKIPRFEPPAAPIDGELVNVRQAAAILGTASSTIHRWLNDGFIAGEQLTPGAPWRIRITDELRSRFVDASGEGYVTMQVATRSLGVSRQTVLQRVKRGELAAVHVRRGRHKGLRITLIHDLPDLFNQRS
jgi:DNA invertase Pin-like site-specific DNA recombinase/predicted DNA-binding transcriptional regulator AlpA